MSAFKNFGITFLVSVLIFGIVAYFVVGFLTSTVSGILADENDRLDNLFTEPAESSNINKTPTKDVPQVEGDSFTLLFAVTDKREGTFKYYPKTESEINAIDTTVKGSDGILAEGYHTVKMKSIVLLRVSKETGDYTIIPIPSNSKVYTNKGGGYTLLEDVAYFYNNEFFRDKVYSMTGIMPDYTAVINVTDLPDLLDSVGSFTCYVPEDIYSDGKNYVPKPAEPATTETTTVTTTPAETTAVTTAEPEVKYEKAVSAGNVSVSKSNIEAIMLYENYADGADSRAELVANMFKGFLERFSKLDDSSLSFVYSKFAGSKIETDMTDAELVSKGEILRAYDRFTTTVEKYPGKISADGNFIPDTTGAIKSYMALRLPADPSKQ